MPVNRILLVDDDPDILETIRFFLEKEGHAVTAVGDAERALEALALEPYDLLLTDLMLPGISGSALIHETLARHPQMVCVLITAHGSIGSAIEVMKEGAYDYVQKPLELEKLGCVVARGLERRRLLTENVTFRNALLLHEVSLSLCASLDLSQILERVLDAVVREMRTDHAWLLLRTEGNALALRAARGIPAEAPAGTVIDASRCLGGAVLATGRALLLPREDPPAAPRSKALGEDRFLSALLVPLRARDALVGVLGVGVEDPARRFTPAEEKALSILAAHAAVAIENARLHADLQRRYLQVILGFSRALESKDPYLRGHSERVAAVAREIGREMGLDEKTCEVLYHAGLLHDLGKIGVSDMVLHKPARLNNREFDEIKRHPAVGREILSPIADLAPVAEILYTYHEKVDGSGYPQGLRGDAIPLAARIVAVADGFDAMTSGRVYQATMPRDAARDLIRKLSGTSYDPEVVAAFLRLPPQAFPPPAPAGPDAGG